MTPEIRVATPDGHPLLSSEQAATILGVSLARVRWYLSVGRIAGAFRLNGDRGVWLIPMPPVVLPGQPAHPAQQ